MVKVQSGYSLGTVFVLQPLLVIVKNVPKGCRQIFKLLELNLQTGAYWIDIRHGACILFACILFQIMSFLYQPLVSGIINCLTTGFQMQASQDLANVILDRAFGKEQTRANLLIH